MSVTHHPSPELLAGFAAGTLDAGEHLAVAVHASGCSTCRRLLRAVEGIGGSTLEAIEPARDESRCVRGRHGEARSIPTSALGARR